MRQFRRGSAREDGAAAVEFALLLPLFLMLAFGTISAGFAFSREINISQAAREASRYGATYDIAAAGGINAWLQQVDTALTQSAGRRTEPLGGFDYRCVALVVTDDTGAIDTRQSRYAETTGSATFPGRTGGGGCPGVTAPALTSAKLVQTVLERDVDFFAVLVNRTLDLDAVSSSPYEGKLP